MITLPADLTPAQVRQIGAAIHTALTGEQVEWHWHITQEGPCYRTADGIVEVPAYLTDGNANALLAEKMLKEGQSLHAVWNERNGMCVWTHGVTACEEFVGYGPTYFLAVAACYMDWQGTQP